MTAFSVGMIISFFLHSFRIRFSVTFLLVLLISFGIYKFIGSADVGEFDTFYILLSFFIYAAIFIIGWIIGFGFARYSFFPWIISIAVFFLAVSFMITDILTLQGQMNAGVVRMATGELFSKPTLAHRFFMLLFMLFVPVLFYCIYLISMNEILRKLTAWDTHKLRYLLKRSAVIAALLLIILLSPLAYIYFFGFPEALQDGCRMRR